MVCVPRAEPGQDKSMKSVRVRVHGEVQGVFFRDTVSREAERAGVAGWVRNCSDGAVEAHFEGDDEAVDGLVDFCGSGPDRASVERVETEPADPEGGEGFTVR